MSEPIQETGGGRRETNPPSAVPRPLSRVTCHPVPCPTSPDPRPPTLAPRPLRTGVVILAAGASTRMGTSKQLLVIDGQTLLQRTVEAALATPAWPVIVVLGANAEQIRPTLARYPVLVTENPAWAEGMASSIRAGITTLQQFSRHMDAGLIALCDQPAFSSATIERLIAAQRSSGKSIVAARYTNRHGAPAIFLREHFSTLAHLTGEEGARALLNGDPSQVTAVDLPELALDLDTPADVTAFQKNSP